MFGKFIYFSSDVKVYDKQLRERIKINESQSTKKIPDAVGIAALVEFIKNPELGLSEISRLLNRQGVNITEIRLKDFLESHGVLKKNGIYGGKNSASVN